MKRKMLLTVMSITLVLGIVGCGKEDNSRKEETVTASVDNVQKEQTIENTSESTSEEGKNDEETVKEADKKDVIPKEEWPEGYEYDANGNLTRMHNNYYEYDAAGNMIKSTLKEEGNYKEAEYAYDSAGNKIKEVCSWHEYWEEWAYDDAGKVIKYAKHRKSDDSIILQKEYNERGKITNAFVRYSDGTEYPVAVFEYDEKGRPTKYSMYNEQDPKVYEGCEVYEYGDGDLPVKTYKYNFKDELVRAFEHQYDEQGRALRDDFEFSNSMGTYTGYILYTYEDNGNWTQAEYIMDVLQSTTVYDSKGNVVETK